MLTGLTGLATAMLAGALLHASAGPAGSSLAPVRTDEPSSSSAKTAQAIDLAGKAVDPFAVAAGKPLVLIFVRTDCPISNRYAPTIESLNKKYSGTTVFMLVYPDKSETPPEIEKHLHAYGYKMAALRDPQHVLVGLSKAEVTPESAVFNGKGKLVYHGRIDNWYTEFGRARSAPTTHELDEAIQAALNGRPSPASVGGVGCYISDLQ